MAMRWSCQETYELIHHIEQAPDLWNPDRKSLDYIEKKQVALDKIANKVRRHPFEVKMKFNNLRIQFHHELRKRNNAIAAKEERCKTTWEYFNALEFLKGTKVAKQEMPKIIKLQNTLSIDLNKPRRKRTPPKKQSKLEECKEFGATVAKELRSIQLKENRKKLKNKILKDIRTFARLEKRCISYESATKDDVDDPQEGVSDTIDSDEEVDPLEETVAIEEELKESVESEEFKEIVEVTDTEQDLEIEYLESSFEDKE